jgi:DNA (cytosine-5)-methyltransferase 1
MNVLSLFSGIGGLELGLERAGMTVVGQVELDPFCRRVLRAHWPEVPLHDDVRTAARWWLGQPRPPVDVVAGGFPCQPFSVAGDQTGVDDARWLWPAMADVIAAVRPDWVIIENVPALAADQEAFGWVLGDLAGLRFDGEWGMVSACAMGAPHTRNRLFVLAYSDRVARSLAGQCVVRGQAVPQTGDPDRDGWRPGQHWLAEPGVGRVADGVPARVDRLRALGNAVVPQVAEHIGRLVMEAA